MISLALSHWKYSAVISLDLRLSMIWPRTSLLPYVRSTPGRTRGLPPCLTLRRFFPSMLIASVSHEVVPTCAAVLPTHVASDRCQALWIHRRQEAVES